MEVVCSQIDSHESKTSSLVDIVSECQYGKFSTKLKEVLSNYNPTSILLAYSLDSRYDSLYQVLFESSFEEVEVDYKFESAEELLKYVL